PVSYPFQVMITPVILPQLGDTMDAGTITRWFKKEGDAVKKGEPLFEVLTDKANIEVEATASGFLRSILCGENETAPTGKTIAYLTTTVDEPLPTSPLSPPLQGEGKEELPAPVGRGGGDEELPAPVGRGGGGEEIPAPAGGGGGGGEP